MSWFGDYPVAYSYSKSYAGPLNVYKMIKSADLFVVNNKKNQYVMFDFINKGYIAPP